VKSYSEKIYESWREAQLQKYADLLPRIEAQLRAAQTLLDIGVGKAWFEEFLRKRGFSFARVVGVDADAGMVRPRKRHIIYRIDADYRTDETFDFVVCLDALHLLPEPGRLLGYARPGGHVLAAVPLRLREKLDVLGKPLDEGVIGGKEKDYFVLVGKGR
jgi:SAM-dependent methyltransferase